MLELASWVESLIGEELDARSELVFDVESLDFDEFTRSMPQSAAFAQPEATAVALVGIGADQHTPSQKSLAATNHRRGPFRKGWLVPVTATFAIASFILWGRSRRAPPLPTTPVAAAHAALPAPLLVTAVAREPVLDAAVHAEAVPALQSVSSVESPSPRKAAAKSAGPVRPKPVKDCDVPYVIDKNGVKRFKEACF